MSMTTLPDAERCWKTLKDAESRVLLWFYYGGRGIKQWRSNGVQLKTGCRVDLSQSGVFLDAAIISARIAQ